MTFVSTGTFVVPGRGAGPGSGSKLGRWAGGQLSRQSLGWGALGWCSLLGNL